MKMHSFTYSLSFFFIIFISVFDFPTVLSAPLQPEDNPYSKFIDYLLQHNCSMPGKVKIPFPGSSDESQFAYFLKPLKACQTEDALKENDESTLLCKEIFDVIQNITCFLGEPHSEIDSGPLSENVCSDYKAMKDILPKRDDYLSGKLVDDLLCRLFCTSDKHELLCKTLLWSYETQAKIKNAIENEAKEKEPTVDESPNIAPSLIKVSLVQNSTESNKEASDHMESDKSKSMNVTPLGVEKPNELVINSQKSDKPNSFKTEEKTTNTQALDSKANNLSKLATVGDNSKPSEDEKSLELNLKIQETKSSGRSDDNAHITSNKIITSTSKNQKEVTSSVNSESKNVKSPIPAGKESKPITQKDTTKDMSSKNTKDLESDKVSNQDSQDNPINHQENAIDVEEKPLKSNTQTVSTSNASGSEKSNNEKSKTVSDDRLKDNANTDLGTKANSKLEQPISPANTETDNELGYVDFQGQENESKVKQTDSNLPADKDADDKPKLNDFEVPNDTASDADSKLPESTTLQILPDENPEPHQENKDPDQYDDTENEEYSKSEYESSYNPSPKIQEHIIKSSKSVGSSSLSNGYDPFIRSGSVIAHNSGDIPMITGFPEQEDGHFFFYFLSIVLILMAGYLIFHNKQKIIALIVEGRHERRRRSGAGYRKLETK